MKASMWAYSIGSIFSHMPPVPLKGGIPLSTDMPAPVKAITYVAAIKSPAALLINSSNVVLL
jgi:hypothetical protein